LIFSTTATGGFNLIIRMFEPKITKEEVNKLPLAEFSGNIILVDDIHLIKEAVDDLKTHSIVGLDTETKPSFQRGIMHKVSLLQISTQNKCYLFRLNKIGFPDELLTFLADENIKKIGLSLRDDLIGLKKRHIFNSNNFIDLQAIAKDYGILELGLQKMFAIIFGQKISKSQRLSNWENIELSPQQQHYAALDAWASLMIYQELIKCKKLKKKQLQELIAKTTPQQDLTN